MSRSLLTQQELKTRARSTLPLSLFAWLITLSATTGYADGSALDQAQQALDEAQKLYSTKVHALKKPTPAQMFELRQQIIEPKKKALKEAWAEMRRLAKAEAKEAAKKTDPGKSEDNSDRGSSSSSSTPAPPAGPVLDGSGIASEISFGPEADPESISTKVGHSIESSSASNPTDAEISFPAREPSGN